MKTKSKVSRNINEEEGEEIGLDPRFLDNVLDELYDFGADTVKKRKNKSQKKKAKKCSEEDQGKVGLLTAGIDDGVEKRAQDGHCPSEQRKEAVDSGTSTESPAAHSTETTSRVEVVTFQDPSKKKRKMVEAPAPSLKVPEIKEKTKTNTTDFSLEKARLEVHRFGITGYQKEQQRVFEQERAIMLGAKPPKKEYVNYKVYQQMIKEKKLKAKEDVKAGTNKKKRREHEGRANKKSSSSVLPAGQVGRFKNGALVLSSKEIEMIKTSRVIK
ncbi:40S small subunit processome assembly factor 1 isoform X2 [Amia ocellicauda]|uniref:40S small subunit processome assembly factor 1 isoform X2 n=1 Tax=Amia ocellicauda TaxID=2972642 RepID=UPI00346492E8